MPRTGVTQSARSPLSARRWTVAESGAPRRGDIWRVDFNPARGREQAGVRPALVVQSDIINQTGFGTVVVLAVSKTTEVKRRGILNVELRKGEGGLRLDSVVKCHQIYTIDRSRLIRRFGHIGPDRMAEIDHATKLVLGFIDV